jgi:hypothetical protein
VRGACDKAGGPGDASLGMPFRRLALVPAVTTAELRGPAPGQAVVRWAVRSQRQDWLFLSGLLAVREFAREEGRAHDPCAGA